MKSQERVLDDIVYERKKQDIKWGIGFTGRRDEFWYLILAEEFGEIANAILEGKTDFDIEEEILQTAAVCVSWLEFREPSEKQPK